MTMTGNQVKTITGQEFKGKDLLAYDDIQDYVVTGHGEAIKTTLDDLDWDGDAVATIVLNLSPDNKKVTGGRINIVGEFIKEPKEFKATKLFEKADKDLRITYQIDDATIFKLNGGTMIGELLNSDQFTWSVTKKTSSRVNTVIDETDYESSSIGDFCVKPYLIPVSSNTAMLTLLAFPMNATKLKADHPLSDKTSFPGMELISLNIPLFPPMDSERGKNWGSPIHPLFILGGEGTDHPNIPSTKEIKS